MPLACFILISVRVGILCPTYSHRAGFGNFEYNRLGCGNLLTVLLHEMHVVDIKIRQSVNIGGQYTLLGDIGQIGTVSPAIAFDCHQIHIHIRLIVSSVYSTSASKV